LVRLRKSQIECRIVYDADIDQWKATDLLYGSCLMLRSIDQACDLCGSGMYDVVLVVPVGNVLLLFHEMCDDADTRKRHARSWKHK
jgi:hypothetical protein